MRRNHRVPGSKGLLAALLMSLFLVGISHAQVGLSSYVLKFTLTAQTRWGESILQPGDYTITIESIAPPGFAVIRTREGRSVAIVMSRLHSEKTSTERSAILMKEKDGQLCVHSLVLADLRMVLIYDPALAREVVQEARASQTVPVMWAKK
ncbi:MAG TPA: hypothetical protein VFF64_04700 [Candidatus Eremiobacteraceae bacterium]|nr:hypothetical protein [Candidatus Eremiobacteraceae bacterium]